jgi:GTP cyclohydrolase I
MKKNLVQRYIEMGDEHAGAAPVTPVRLDAFDLNDEEKIRIIERNFREIMLTLGLDLADDSLAGTPHRVAKMYVQELFSGLNPKNMPKATLFDNKFKYGQMLVEKNITVNSVCEHHFVPIVGRAHVAYVSSGKVIGLSKLNRIVQHFAKRPQVQERLTNEVGRHLQQVLNTADVAVIIDSKHYCVAMRGVQDNASSTVTAFYDGVFNDETRRQELLRYIEMA